MGRACTKRHTGSYAQHLLGALVTLFLPAAAAAAPEKLIDRMIAVVNDDPVLFSEIEKKLKHGQGLVVSEYPAKETDADFEKALQDQVNLELIMQKVEELELEVDDEEVEKEIEDFLKQRNLTRSGLVSALKQQGMTYDQYKEDFRQQMVIRKFQGRVITPLVKVTDKDIEAYYLKKSGSTSDNVNLTMRQIFIEIPQGAIGAVIEGKNARAREVHQKLVNGMAFADAAKIYSDAPNAQKDGGLMPPMRLNELSDEIKRQVAELQVGKFSLPLKLANGYYIFYVDNKTFSGNTDFSRQKRNLEFELRTLELQGQTKKWLAEQRRRSKIRILR